ncbi:MAG: rRNA maturation RNase YbeY [Clostridiaceae bacterium]|nr:rRNA maturation RNase YbeY [Clostridiaceae bacterium]
MKVVIQSKLKKKYLPLKSIKTLMTNVVKTALRIENIEYPSLVSILLVENEEIQRINREYRNKDCVTDVLSFPMLEMKDGKFAVKPDELDMEDGKLFLGDIVVSVPKAIEQANEYGHENERELAFLTLHGLMHLLGYDHESPPDSEIMEKKQEQILSDIGLTRN